MFGVIYIHELFSTAAALISHVVTTRTCRQFNGISVIGDFEVLRSGSEAGIFEGIPEGFGLFDIQLKGVGDALSAGVVYIDRDRVFEVVETTLYGTAGKVCVPV
jgi:hypothetical protein